MSDTKPTPEENEAFVKAIATLDNIGKAAPLVPYVEVPAQPLSMSIAALGMIHVGLSPTGSHVDTVSQLADMLSMSPENVVARLKRLSDRPELYNALGKVRPTGRQGIVLLAGMLISA